jgi:hypothetical protein
VAITILYSEPFTESHDLPPCRSNPDKSSIQLTARSFRELAHELTRLFIADGEVSHLQAAPASLALREW